MAKREKPNPFSSRTSRQPPPVDLRDDYPDDPYDDDFDDYDDFDRRPFDEEHKVFGLGIQSADERQPTYGQGIVFALIIAAALLLCAIIAIGDGDGSVPPMLQRASPLLWAVSLIAIILAVAGAQYSEYVTARTAEEEGDTIINRVSTAWVVPMVSVFASALLIATYHNRWMLLFGPVLAFIGMAASLLSRDLLDEAEDPSVRTAAVLSAVIGIVVAFFAFGAIYVNKFENIIAVPLVTLIAFVLLLEALERAGLDAPTRVLHAGVGAWIMAGTMLALNWWPTWGWGGAAALTAVFYMIYGLLVANAEGRPINRNRLLEYVGVGSVLLIIVALRDVVL